jgi:hypothetical protein
LPDGFTHVYIVTFNQQIISWVAVAALTLIFISSFFTWTITSARVSGPRITKENDAPSIRIALPTPVSMWTGEVVPFIIYAVLLFPTLLFAILALLLDNKIISLPEPFKKMRPWRSLIVAGLAAAGYFALLIHWASTLNFATFSPNTAVFSFVMFLQFLAVVGPLLEYWLQRRKKDEKPVPKIEFRW